ncbi:uncharacterized protein BXZ73DRAFT_105722 [Epithele typhae]|uniref:uncharacterized protein n=1 Tax=Epithele typhae TaxID=378194 RepID=UPI002008765A|nr:uncharacterized protein BXZ73DRAFT_105722 [Epithele typhae]KAH9916744.1 hypothetical protein BXZ73DRAFT_105722 [Epithele typhae]
MALYSRRASALLTTANAELRFARWVYQARCEYDITTIMKLDDEDWDEDWDSLSADPVLDGPRAVQRWIDAIGDDASIVRALVAHGYLARPSNPAPAARDPSLPIRGPSPLTAFRVALVIGLRAASLFGRATIHRPATHTRPWEFALPPLFFNAPLRGWAPSTPYHLPAPASAPQAYELLPAAGHAARSRTFAPPPGLGRPDGALDRHAPDAWTCAHGAVRFTNDHWVAVRERAGGMYAFGPMQHTAPLARFAGDGGGVRVGADVLLGRPDAGEDAPLAVVWACSHGELYVCGPPRGDALCARSASRARLAQPPATVPSHATVDIQSQSQSQSQSQGQKRSASRRTHPSLREEVKESLTTRLHGRGGKRRPGFTARHDDPEPPTPVSSRASSTFSDAPLPASSARTSPTGSLRCFGGHSSARSTPLDAAEECEDYDEEEEECAHEDSGEDEIEDDDEMDELDSDSDADEYVPAPTPSSGGTKRKRSPRAEPPRVLHPSARLASSSPSPDLTPSHSSSHQCGIAGCTTTFPAPSSPTATATSTPASPPWLAHLAAAHALTQSTWESRPGAPPHDPAPNPQHDRRCPLARCALAAAARRAGKPPPTYAAWNSIVRHLGTKHFPARDWRCPRPECAAARPFSRRDALVRHYETKHAQRCPGRTRASAKDWVGGRRDKGKGVLSAGAKGRRGRGRRQVEIESEDEDEMEVDGAEETRALAV